MYAVDMKTQNRIFQHTSLSLMILIEDFSFEEKLKQYKCLQMGNVFAPNRIVHTVDSHFDVNHVRFLGWGETESTWYVGHNLSYCTRVGR
jgi:hypothetical protein